MPPPAGHTHCIIDQRFSRFSIRLRAHDSFTPLELADALDDMFDEESGFDFLPGLPDLLEQLRSLGLGDFSAAFEAFVLRFEGIGTESNGRR